jgi:amidohydrolase
MITDGLYGSTGVPRPDIVLGQHILKYKAGELQFGPGKALAGKKTFCVTICGKGGHASDPQDCIDPVITACHIIIRLQSITSREIDPNETVVITCASIHAGDGPNIIPDEATFTVDIRAYSPSVLDTAANSVERIIKAECTASGMEKEPTITVVESVPPLENSEEVSGPPERSFKGYFGDSAVKRTEPRMASDDFSLLAPEGIPYAYWTIGSTEPELWRQLATQSRLRELAGNHCPFFSPAIQPTLTHGDEALSVAALSFFTKL